MHMQPLKRRALVFALALALGGCASNSFAPSARADAGASLRGKKVFIYSFLDLRDAEFGPTMLAEIDAQLTAALGKSGAAARVLRFKDSDVGRSFAATSGGMTVPIGQTILSNGTEERGFGTDYRLVIFPSKMTLSGAWKYYDIRWEVFDAASGRRVWLGTSQGRHLTMWKNDEDPAARAKTIVDGAVAELGKSGLL